MIPNTTMIAILEARGAVRDLQDREAAATLEERLQVAFGATRHHWIATSEEERFRAGVGGVLLTATPEEQERINTELRLLQGVGAATSGIPVDIGALMPEGFEAVGLLRIWRATDG